MYDSYTYRHPRTLEQAFGCEDPVSKPTDAPANAATQAMYFLAALVSAATVVIAFV